MQALIFEGATVEHMKNREEHEISPKHLNHAKAFF